MMPQSKLSEQVDAYLHDELSPAEIDQLGDWLMEDANHARRFAHEVLHYTELRSACLARGDAECLDEASSRSGNAGEHSLWSYLAELMPPIKGSTSSWWTIGFVVLLLVGGGIALLLTRGSALDDGSARSGQVANKVVPGQTPNGESTSGNSRQIVARLVRLWKPQWSDAARPLAEWAPLVQGQAIDLLSGRAEVFFDAGAQLTLQGPVRFEVLGSKSGRIFHGDLTARVGEHAKGFSLVSSVGKVIDLGTEFGMSVQPDGETDVVVFDGTVDFEHLSSEEVTEGSNANPGAVLSRLTTGEAVRIKPDGSVRRIVAIDSNRFTWAAMGNAAKADRSVVIHSISDTIRTPGAGPFYEIVHGGLGEDVRAYVDRPHEWNGVDDGGIPTFLVGADYIKTFNDDKLRGAIELTVELAQPADLYVFWDNRAAEIPPWLLDSFTDTGLKIGLDEAPYRNPLNGSLVTITSIFPGNRVVLKPGTGPGNSVDIAYSIWHREVSKPGPVKLGATLGAKYTKGAMYGIAAVAKK